MMPLLPYFFFFGHLLFAYLYNSIRSTQLLFSSDESQLIIVGGCNFSPNDCDLISIVSLIYNFGVLAAGNAFCQAAHLHLQMQSKHDAATNFIDAGNAFKKADPQGMFCLCFY